MSKTLWIAALFAVSAGTLVMAASGKDGGVIQNSRATNVPAYQIKVWSDGSGEVKQGDAAPRSVTMDPQLAERFLADAKAARATPGTPGHCMKSASFGTTTTVLWHGWKSSDLQCPPLTPPMAALALDVRQIAGAAGVGTGPVRRIPLPNDQRMNPSATPEVTPT